MVATSNKKQPAEQHLPARFIDELRKAEKANNLTLPLVISFSPVEFSARGILDLVVQTLNAKSVLARFSDQPIKSHRTSKRMYRYNIHHCRFFSSVVVRESPVGMSIELFDEFGKRVFAAAEAAVYGLVPQVAWYCAELIDKS